MFRRLTCFHHFLSLPLSPTMVQPLPRLRRTSRTILDYCRRTVRLLWTSTLRRKGICCWEIRRTYLPYRCRYCLFRSPMFRVRCRSRLPLSGSQSWKPSLVSPDLSQEGPFDVDQTVSESEDPPRVLDSLPGCQYRMTSYDAADRPDLNPAYGLHLHDPLFLEYVGAPEWARLLSRAPDYCCIICPGTRLSRWLCSYSVTLGLSCRTYRCSASL